MVAPNRAFLNINISLKSAASAVYALRNIRENLCVYPCFFAETFFFTIILLNFFKITLEDLLKSFHKLRAHMHVD